ncbi:MAG: hypothetical protein ACR2PL_23065 [Dehalococcoidia bacterium]
MRPTASELLHGVRTLLLVQILPEVMAPHLRAQVILALGLLDAAAVELNDAPAAYGEEQSRMAALVWQALPIVRRAGTDGSLASDLESAVAPSAEAGDRSLEAQTTAAVRRLDLLDRLAALCDEAIAAGSDEQSIDSALLRLARSVDVELHAIIARRTAWMRVNV